MQQLTAELDTQVNSGRAASEQLQKLKGEASVLQLWQQNVQAERAAEIEAVRAAKQVGSTQKASGGIVRGGARGRGVCEGWAPGGCVRGVGLGGVEGWGCGGGVTGVAGGSEMGPSGGKAGGLGVRGGAGDGASCQIDERSTPRVQRLLSSRSPA